MRCPNCGHENPEGRRYCEGCGEKLIDIEALKARARRRSGREAALYRREALKEGLDTEEAERRRRRSRKQLKPWVGIALLLAVIAAVVLIIILVGGGGESGPEKAVREFFNAIKNRDATAYLKHTELELYKMAERGEYEPDPYTEGIEYDTYVLEGLAMRLVREEGDYAEVEVVGGYFEGIFSDGAGTTGVDFARYPRLVRLVRIENVWMVQDYQMMKLPYPIAEVLPDEPEFPEAEESG